MQYDPVNRPSIQNLISELIQSSDKNISENKYSILYKSKESELFESKLFKSNNKGNLNFSLSYSSNKKNITISQMNDKPLAKSLYLSSINKGDYPQDLEERFQKAISKSREVQGKYNP